jgi:phosphoribosyl 1,2-cyclic phosphate phosphodiesterase
MVIPKPLCRCRVCSEARQKGGRYVRTGPSAFIHDENLLIDAPAEIDFQLNRERIEQVDYLIFSHLDPDHVEGFRVVEQITLDFRTWEAYPDKQIQLILPKPLDARIRDIHSIYGPVIDFYEQSGFVTCRSFWDSIQIGSLHITAIPVDRGSQIAFVHVFQKEGKKIVYAPCDIKPFPEDRREVRNPDLLVIQPGIFEGGLPLGFFYPEDHISRTTLYTFEDTLRLAQRIGALETLFVHLEEYWNRSYDDYLTLEQAHDHIRFAHDGLRLTV